MIAKRIKINGVEGWLTSKEGRFLFDSACRLKLPIVEIGSWKGLSTIYLAKSRNRVYAVDPHTGSKEHRKIFGEVDTYRCFINNIINMGVDDSVIPMRATSMEVASKWSRPIGFLFIDGSHELADVRADFFKWERFIVSGGAVAIHDTTSYYGPHVVAKEYVLKSHRWKNVRQVGTMIYAEKGRENFLDRINKLYIGLKNNLMYLTVKYSRPLRVKLGMAKG